MSTSTHAPRRSLPLILGGLALLFAGALGGAGAVSMTRPAIEMAPSNLTTIAHLAGARGIVSVRGKVAETFADRFIIDDGSGHVLVDAGPRSASLQPGSTVTAQGRVDHGELRARFLVDGANTVTEVGPPGPPPPHGPHHAPPPPADGPPASSQPPAAPPPPALDAAKP